MFSARYISLALVAIALVLGGCASVDRQSDFSKKGDEVTQKKKETCTGWGCASNGNTPVIIVSGDDRGYGYGGDYRRYPYGYGGWSSYAAGPAPHVVLGPLVHPDGQHHYAEVEGVVRFCHTSGGRPDSCTNQQNARNWPRR